MEKSKTINPELIADISVYSSALPILAFLIFKQNWSERLKWVCLFIICLSVAADIFNSYLASKNFTNIWVINIYFLLDSFLVLYFFYWNFRYKNYWTLLIAILLAVILVSWFINYFANEYTKLDSLTNGIETLSIIILSILFFYEQLTKPQNLFVYSTAAFWIVAGLLVYKAGTFFLFLYFNTLEQSQKKDFGNYYIINSAFLIVRSLLFTIAFLTKKPLNNKKHNLKTTF